jgi:hypothetical protein
MSRLPFHRPPGFLPHRPRERYCRAGHAEPQLTARSNPVKSIADGAQRFLVPTPAALRLPDDGLLRNPSAGSLAGGKPENQHIHAWLKVKNQNKTDRPFHHVRPWTPDFGGKATPLTTVSAIDADARSRSGGRQRSSRIGPGILTPAAKREISTATSVSTSSSADCPSGLN